MGLLHSDLSFILKCPTPLMPPYYFGTAKLPLQPHRSWPNRHLRLWCMQYGLHRLRELKTHFVRPIGALSLNPLRPQQYQRGLGLMVWWTLLQRSSVCGGMRRLWHQTNRPSCYQPTRGQRRQLRPKITLRPRLPNRSQGGKLTAS